MSSNASFSGPFTLGAGAVSDQQVATNAGINATKLQHGYYGDTNFNQVIGATPVTAEYIVHVANQPGSITDFQALLNVTGTATSITFDLKKNGVSVLSAVITITNANSNRQVVTGTVTTPNFVAGDVLSIAMTVSTSTGAQGPRAWAGIVENTSP